MALGRNGENIHGTPSGVRSNVAWQEDNSRDAVADAFAQTGFENIIIADKVNRGEHYYPSYFLDIDEEKLFLHDGQAKSQQSFDLVDLVLSTGAAKKQ